MTSRSGRTQFWKEALMADNFVYIRSGSGPRSIPNEDECAFVVDRPANNDAAITGNKVIKKYTSPCWSWGGGWQFRRKQDIKQNNLVGVLEIRGTTLILSKTCYNTEVIFHSIKVHQRLLSARKMKVIGFVSESVNKNKTVSPSKAFNFLLIRAATPGQKNWRRRDLTYRLHCWSSTSSGVSYF